MSKRPRHHRPAWMALALCLAAGAGHATDVGFWHRYSGADERTYLLLSFDDGEAPTGEAGVKEAELLGDATREPGGKFGGALRLRGAGAVRCEATRIFPGGYVSIEAWLRLKEYPEEKAYVVFRPAKVDDSAKYDPAADVTKGFSLAVDSHGALHLTTTNCYYGRTVRTSSGPGVVPLGRWVHVAGLSVVHPIAKRRLYVDGHEVASEAITWGEGLTVHGDEESEPAPLFVGNNAQGTAGLSGSLDQVRVHRWIAAFWPREDMAWTERNAPGEIPDGKPYFLDGHEPSLYLPLNGTAQPAANAVAEVQVQAREAFVPGVCGPAHAGPLEVRAPKLLDLRRGTLEFWLRPVGVNSLSDRNHRFVQGPFTLYLFNCAGLRKRPLTLYFRKDDGRLHFVHAHVAVRPGRWYHLAVTWREEEITIYVDGEKEARSHRAALARAANKGLCNHLAFPSARSVVDEVRLYPAALTEGEVANAFHRYRDRTKLAAVGAAAVDVWGQYLPSSRRIHYRLVPNMAAGEIERVALRLTDERGKEWLTGSVALSDQERPLDVPELPDGKYALAATAVLADGPKKGGGAFRFRRHHFAWEGNTLGITEEVCPPFEPIRTRGRTVRVVQRQYAMNDFGLWDQVVAKGRDILAAPLRLRYTTAEGERPWASTRGSWSRTTAKAATWTATAQAPAVQAESISRIEVDGCMRVTLGLSPGTQPTEIRSLWLEIPLKDAAAPLMHAIGDGLRHNHAGATPGGQGVVWDGSKARRTGPWRNAFVPYIWLGAEERGLAWFAENDRGWVAEKTMDAPTHELVREGERLTLKVYLVNTPVTLEEPRELVFGLQASPTKPMPSQWRKRLPDIPGGLAVVPWGGLACASQAPFRDDWRIVDKVLECRQGKPFDKAWFQAYDAQHDPPPAHGTWPWLDQVGHFAHRARNTGPERPLSVYQEEMCSTTARPEFAVFQDEWVTVPSRYDRTELPDHVFERGYCQHGRPVRVTFPRSYRDFGCAIADKWLRRGVSLYWDNTYPHLSTNPRTSAAYRCADGRIQPALVLWAQRRYAMRVWHLVQKWRRQRPEPIEFIHHMTNTLVLPIHTWATANLDHELGRASPFPPDWLRTETIGRQVGNFPLSLYEVAGRDNKAFKALPAPRRRRIEWGLRAVHEIQRHGEPETLLRDFGYGSDAVAVHNYWEEKPLLRVTPREVKWLALVKPASGEMLLVLASWAADPATATVTVNDAATALARVEDRRVLDAESERLVAETAARPFQVELPAPWGNRVLRIPAPAGAAASPDLQERPR
ncbi:MAG: glycoside hydrolase domain-containing protein [bacterium]